MKKAQVQLQESLFVIIIFVVLLIIGLIIFYRFTISGITADINSYEDFKFRAMINTVPSMTEFRCSSLGQDKECIDLEKVKAFTKLNMDYFQEFGYKTVSLEIIYPKENMESNIDVYSKKPKKYTTTKKISTFVSVYDLEQDRYKVGKLIIEAYS